MRAEVDKVIASGEPVDTYINPAARHDGARSRRKGDALPPTRLWSDLDGDPTDPSLLETLDPLIVASGSHGGCPGRRGI
jgi:hypothetical protein